MVSQITNFNFFELEIWRFYDLFYRESEVLWFFWLVKNEPAKYGNYLNLLSILFIEIGLKRKESIRTNYFWFWGLPLQYTVHNIDQNAPDGPVTIPQRRRTNCSKMRLKPFTMENTKIIYYKIETTGLFGNSDYLEIISIAAIGDNTTETFIQKG